MMTIMKSGELYMEFKKGACQRTKGELCEFCTETGWSGPEMHRIPRPEPDYERLPDYHYKCVFDTSSQNPDGTERNPDDYQPRANLKTAFKDDLISLGDNNSVKAFPDKFVVKEALVREYLEHLENLELGKQLRSRQRERERIENKAKIYEDYDWNRLVEERELGKLKVFELDRYISHHKLPTVGKKADKIRRITAHVYQNRAEPLQDQYVHCSRTDSDQDYETDEEEKAREGCVSL